MDPVVGQPPNHLPPCVLFEDEHLLVVNKPAGWNTHAPTPFAGEGIYDWLKHREPRWATLAILHRLDKETSGVLVFGKTPLANRSLTEQFLKRAVRKKYLLVTDREPNRRELTVKSNIARFGERYASGAQGEPAETKFQIRNPKLQMRPQGGGSALTICEVLAEPHTGRTHQIRVHAAENRFPILGDTLYGGAPYQRVCLHAAELCFRHPATQETVSFSAPADFAADARLGLRKAILEDDSVTNAVRLIHSASDGWPGWYVDRVGDYLLSQSERELTSPQQIWLAGHASPGGGTYHKVLSRQVRGSHPAQSSPRPVGGGAAAPERFQIRENGVEFELSFSEGYSVGLFFDQRDNRRRLLTGHFAAGFSLRQFAPLRVLNCFAYTCGFSVCAALGGGQTTSLDLSKKYLEWGKRNFIQNDLDPAQHDFIYGDTFDWLHRLAKKQRVFDVVLLDPPTFSQSKESGVFRADKDYGRLVKAALAVLQPGGVLFASTNAAEWKPEAFLAQVEAAIRAVGREIKQRHYIPQPPDFPISREEPAYLKTVWLRVA